MTIDPALLSNPIAYAVLIGAGVIIVLAKQLDSSPIAKWIKAGFSWAAQRRVRDEDRAYAELEDKLERILENLKDLKIEVKSKDDQLHEQFQYITWITSWARDVMLIVAAAVPPLAIPRFLSMSEWRQHPPPPSPLDTGPDPGP